MRRAAAIVCLSACAVCAVSTGCTSHRDSSTVPRAPDLTVARASSTPPSVANTSVVTSGPAPRSSTPITPGADDPAAVPVIAADPTELARQLVAAEQAVRAPGTSPDHLLAAARTAQVAYRRLGLHPEWDATVLPIVPASLRTTVVANLRARRELRAITTAAPKDLLPAWRIDTPAPAHDLLAWYRAAGEQFGVGWQYLAAVTWSRRRSARSTA